MALTPMPARPAEGLYDPSFEHDACGVAFIAQLSGEASHDIVAKGLIALENLDHRGATGADAAAGDGAGMLLQVPHQSCVRWSTSTFPRLATTRWAWRSCPPPR